MENIKIGDVVKVKGHSNPMTVRSVTDDKVCVNYFIDGNIKQKIYPLNEITRIR